MTTDRTCGRAAFAAAAKAWGGVAAGAALLLLTGCAARDPEALLQEAASAASASQWALAVDLTDQALDSAPHSIPARILNGLALHQLRQTDDALEALERAATEAPDHFGAQYFHGWALCEAGRYADALRPLERAYALRAEHPDLLILLSRCCLEQNLRKGIVYLQALREHRAYEDSPEVYNALAMLWLGQGEPDKAREYLLLAETKAPGKPVLLQNLAVLYDQYLNDPERALRYYRYCLSESQKIGDRQREARALRRLKALSRADRQ
jgi:tetratricopeptide (TPR) repeat protein